MCLKIFHLLNASLNLPLIKCTLKLTAYLVVMKNCLGGVNESEWLVAGVKEDNSFLISKYMTHSSSIFLCKVKLQKAKMPWFTFLKEAICIDWSVGCNMTQ